MSVQRICRSAARALLVVALAAVGCTDLPSSLGWDHTYPEGLIVRENGTVVVRVDEDGEVTGSLTVRAGGTTGELDVVFLDEKGGTIVPGDDEYLEVTISLPDLATFEQPSPGAFRGRIRGLKVGQTSVLFTLKEGEVGRGRGLWTSSAIKLNVTP